LRTLYLPLSALLQDQLILGEKAQSGPKLQRLDKVIGMSKAGAMSNTIAFSEGVDLESINKGKVRKRLPVLPVTVTVFNVLRLNGISS